MSIQKAYIIDAATGADVEVQLDDDISAEFLLDIDSQWAPHRQELKQKLKTLGIAPDRWPQSLHWNWGHKGLRLALRDPDDFRIMALYHHGVWEAVIVTLFKNHIASLPPDAGKPLVYIDYLEVAPWNWTVDNLQTRKFKAVGSILVRAAIEQSYAKRFGGRLGLHALPQAASFYVNQGFQFLKNDPQKQNLAYYELSAAEALKRTGRR